MREDDDVLMGDLRPHRGSAVNLKAICGVIVLVGLGLGFALMNGQRSILTRLESLPTGLAVSITPHTIAAIELEPDRAWQYGWEMQLEVNAIDGDVVITEFGLLYRDGNRWEQWDAMDGSAFASMFTNAAGSTVRGGEPATRGHRLDWHTLEHSEIKWYFVGQNEAGDNVKGEATAVLQARLDRTDDELAALIQDIPPGIELTVSPSSVKALRFLDEDTLLELFWHFDVSISTAEPIEIEQFGSLYRTRNQWHVWHLMEQDEFVDYFELDSTEIDGIVATDLALGMDRLVEREVTLFVVGVNARGERVKGEAKMIFEAEIDPDAEIPEWFYD